MIGKGSLVRYVGAPSPDKALITGKLYGVHDKTPSGVWLWVRADTGGYTRKRVPENSLEFVA